WSADGPEHVAQRAGTLVPTHRLALLGDVIRPLLVPLSLLEPSLREFCLGLLDADGVPEDRLSPDRARAAQPAWNSCR
ncbi:MAG: hypothetical protein LBE59_10650, partial [Nevskiaceae bacterium]|nr:hypothetical protein [Nevskiaceae bacterium]